jgi:[ribosomal protein S5]-alanine N-acetyltransferase
MRSSPGRAPFDPMGVNLPTEIAPHVKLETERLELRSASRADAGLLLKLFSIPEVWRYLPPGPPFTLERAEAGIERRLKLEAERGFSPMLVFKKDNGEFIGNAGLQGVPDTPEVEIAYHYLPSVWGKGYGTEAAIVLLADGLDRVGLDRVIAICVPENVGSWRIMEKAGMQYAGLASYYGLTGLKKYVAERGSWSTPARHG